MQVVKLVSPADRVNGIPMDFYSWARAAGARQKAHIVLNVDSQKTLGHQLHLADYRQVGEVT